jgi:hypothetical protein
MLKLLLLLEVGVEVPLQVVAVALVDMFISHHNHLQMQVVHMQ